MTFEKIQAIIVDQLGKEEEECGEWVCLPSTGSPFGHHPRLRMVCPLRGQWMDNELFLLLLRKINYGEECVFS